jgi:hypothetical protein
MLRAYEYFFYRLYRWQSRYYQSSLLAAISAFIFLMMVFVWSFFGLLELIELCLGGLAPILPKLSTVQVLIYANLAAVPQYFLLVHDHRYENIAKRYESESLEQNRRRGRIVVAYVIISLFVLFGGSILLGLLQHTL